MTSEQLFIAEPEFLYNQQVIEIDDTVDSEGNSTSYCVCERQAGSSDDIDYFNAVQCNLTQSTQSFQLVVRLFAPISNSNNTLLNIIMTYHFIGVINIIIVSQRSKFHHIITITRDTALSFSYRPLFAV
jgi:hypothetical protein